MDGSKGPVAVILDSAATLRATGVGRCFNAIQSAINDDGEIVECARWLAARTGFALESRR